MSTSHETTSAVEYGTAHLHQIPDTKASINGGRSKAIGNAKSRYNQIPKDRIIGDNCALKFVRLKDILERKRTDHIMWVTDRSEDEMEMLNREDRKREAERFRRNYTYGSTLADGCDMEKKTFISSSGTRSWLVKSSGIMWAAVHGMNSICVVTKDEKLDVNRVHGFLKCTSEIAVIQSFRITVVSEIEDLAHPSSGLFQLSDLDNKIKKPFGVVSLIPDINKFHEETGHEVSSVIYDGKTAIEFLEEKMKSDCAFSFNETVEAAISAFQHLFHRKFKANEIRVCVLRQGRTPFDLRRSLVEERLSVINN